MTIKKLYDEVKKLVDDGKGDYTVVIARGLTDYPAQCIYIKNKDKKVSVI